MWANIHVMAGEPILIVDDALISLKLTRALLARQGYEVTTASSAEDALEIMRLHRPALVLADIMLPGMNGLELARLIKNDNGMRGILVVAHSALTAEEDERRALDAGCDGYLRKPVDPRTLGACIRELLDRHAGSPRILTPDSHAPSVVAPVQDPGLLALRSRFLEEGRGLVKQWESDLDGILDSGEAGRVAHQWVGAAGMLGCSAISQLSHEMGLLLRVRPIDMSELRDCLAKLAQAFDAS